MTIKSKLATLFAVGTLASTVAAHAQSMAPDPNLAPSTVGAEAKLPSTSASGPELAAAPDPNVAPSTIGEEAELPQTTGPQLAAAPDPNLAPSTAGEEAAIQSGMLSAQPSAAGDTSEAIQ